MPTDCSECKDHEGCEECYGGIGCKYWKEIEEMKVRKNREKREEE